MKPARTLPPAAAPVSLLDVLRAGARTPAADGVLAAASAEMRAYLRAEHVFFVSSGKAALTLTLQALSQLDGRRSVAIPAYTCFTVPAAVIRAGLEPVLVDVDPVTMDFEPASLRRALDHADLLAVVPTHLFGKPADVTAVRRLLSGRGVFIVEDAAQALGVVDDGGQRLGTLGDVSIFSLARGKHVTTGAGGVIATSSARIAGALRDIVARIPKAGGLQSVRVWADLAMMSAFIHPSVYWFPAGLPFLHLGETRYEPDFSITQMPSTAAAALHGWRARLEADNAQRAAAVEAWRDVLGPVVPDACRGPLLRLPIVLRSVRDREALAQASQARGLGVSTMYPSAIHQIPALQARFATERYRGAEILAERLVTLPTHRFVQARDRRTVRAIWPEAGIATSSERIQTASASC